MKKLASILFFALFVTVSAFAQSVQEGVNHLYAERYASAKNAFEKLVAANPNNLEAVYWLGQTHISAGNIAAARQVYEKVLATNGNAPLILVGMGHLHLLEAKTAEARQNFEKAITLSRGKKGDDPAVLNAIGRANIESTNGDVAYAITQLTAASKAAPANADIYINLGNAYRKARDGGQAVANYSKALAFNPALANYRMARIYETQRNWDIVVDHLNKAIAADPKFAPAFLRHYVYNLFHKGDYAAADEWAKKYIASADPSVQNEYFRAQTLFQQKNYNEAIAISKRVLEQSTDPVNPSVYRLLAYSYVETGDTATARQYVDQLFEKTKKDELVAKDYTLKATIYSKERPEQVVQIYLDAADEDTTLRNKQLILQEAIDWAKSTGKKVSEADLRLAAYKLTPNPNPAFLFQIGLPYYQGGAFKKADSVFTAYSQALPDSIYGHYWTALSRSQLDPSMEQGLAIDAYKRTIEIAERDKERFRSMALQSIMPLAGYYNNVKKDKETAIMYLQKGLEFDPNNTTFQNTLKVLQTPGKAAPAKAAPAKKTAPAKKPAAPKKKG